MPDRSTQTPNSPRRSRAAMRTAACAALLLTVPVVSLGGAALAHAATATPPAATSSPADAPFTQSVTPDAKKQITTWTFDAKANLDYLGLMYTPKAGGLPPQSLDLVALHKNNDPRVKVSGTEYTFTEPFSATASQFTYHWVYTPQGQPQSAPTPELDQTGTAVDPTPPPNTGGGFPLDIKAPAGSDYWVTVVGQQKDKGHYVYIKPDGSSAPVTQQQPTADSVASGMSYEVNKLNRPFQMPAWLEGGRIFISNKPMVMPPAEVNGQPSDTGYQQPDLNNSKDPNQLTKFDFFEQTFKNATVKDTSPNPTGPVAWGGNTTQVDGFGIPMTAELKQGSSHFDRTVGIKDMTTRQVIAKYLQTVDPIFAKEVVGTGSDKSHAPHIIAPRSADVFKAATATEPAGAGADYFDQEINDAWSNWKSGNPASDQTQPFTLDVGDGVVFTGNTGADGTGPLTFTKWKNGVSVGTGEVAKPTTQAMVACSDSLATGSDDDKLVEANVCAAGNRGMLTEAVKDWGNPSMYFPQPKPDDPQYNLDHRYNQYAAFFHTIALPDPDRKTSDGDPIHPAYGFAYDDVHDMSSVMILPNFDAPDSLTLTIGG
ncbi:beta-1,3-glucanase family protein [Streptomyces sp. IBSNAI002]|uniref:beta-1,3-glucanase family protein n=1 Tax=Streptomyces sp. IBSNAI002 TaxID=3457500 RepID=UPI003FCFF3ED